MKKLYFISFILILLPAITLAQEKDAKTRFYAGITAEEIDGDLEKAINIYQEILKSENVDRQLAARCLYHIGVCHDKLESGEAMEYFTSLLEKYPDQSDLADLARTRITKLEDANTFIDPRDGHKYKYVTIGDQTWMAENLAFMPHVNPPMKQEEGIWVYDYGLEGEYDVAVAKSTENYNKYGCLYDWPTAMDLDPKYLEEPWGGDPSSHQGICPPGWRMPTDGDWKIMEKTLGMPDSMLNETWRRAGTRIVHQNITNLPPVGKYMKSSNGWSSDGEGNNSSGLKLLPGGERWTNIRPNKVYSELGYIGSFWTATEGDSESEAESGFENGAWFRQLRGRESKYFRKDGIDRDVYPKSNGYSVRCIKATEPYKEIPLKNQNALDEIHSDEINPIKAWNQWFGDMSHSGLVNSELPRALPKLIDSLPAIGFASTHPVQGEDCFYYLINDSTIGKYSNGKAQKFWISSEKFTSYTPVYSRNKLIIQLKDYSLICLNTLTKKIIWTKTYFENTNRRYSYFMSANENDIFVGGSDNYLYSIDIESGEINWKFKSNHPIHISAAASENTVYFTSFNLSSQSDYINRFSYLYAVNAETGKEIWKAPFEGTIFSSPVLTDNTIILGGGDYYLYAFDCNTGKKKWRFYAEGNVWDCPAASDGKVFFQSKGGHFFALDISSGKELWRFKFNSLQGGYFHPLVGKNEVIFGSLDACFYALDTNNGDLLWKFPLEERIGINAVWIKDQLLLSVPNKILIVE